MVDNSSKVIPLRPSQSRVAGELLPLVEIKKLGKEFLKGCFQSVFDVVDDTFFDLADRAENQSLQTAYFDAMRSIRLERKTIESQLLVEVDERLSSVGGSKADKQRPRPDSTDKLELVAEEHLEEIIALDTMVSRCLQNAAPAIDELNARLSTLLSAVMTTPNNPFGPEVVCDIFGAATKSLSIDIRSKLVFYKLFERYVLNELVSFYAKANQMLDEMDVAPAKPVKAKKPRPVTDSEEKIQSQRDNRQEKQARKSSGSASRSPDHGLLINRLNRLLKTPEAGTATAESGLEEASLSDLIDQIADVQAGLQQSEGQIDKISLTELLENQLSKRVGQPPVSLKSEDKTVVQVVDELLNHFGAKASIPTEIESLIQSLKLPILSIALQDAAFFDKDKHPARRLLNEVAQLSVQFESEQTNKEDVLYKLIQNLVKTLIANNNVDTATLTLLFADFLEKIGGYERRILAVEKRLLEELEAQEKINQAHTHISVLLAEMLEDKILPKAIVDIAEQAWSKVLFLTYLKSGDDSEQWAEDVEAINLLVELAQIGGVEPDKLNQLLALLDSRLEHTAIDAYKRTELIQALQQCFATDAQNRQQVLVESFRARLPGKMVDDEGPLEAGVDQAVLEKAEKLKKGAWVELTSEDDFHKRCKLAGVIGPSGKYLFVNRQGAKEESMSRARVALGIENNKLVVLDNSDLFDRALNKVISDIRHRNKP